MDPGAHAPTNMTTLQRGREREREREGGSVGTERDKQIEHENTVCQLVGHTGTKEVFIV